MPDIYLDNAASTRPEQEVLDLMAQIARQEFANPSSAHAPGAAAARILEQARLDLAAALGATDANELTFTSGGTESNAWAILGLAARARGRHIVVGALEHPAVLRNVERLARQENFEMTVVAPDATGIILPASVISALRPDTAIVAVMLVNNEIGTVQPIGQIAQALGTRARDAGQSPPHLHVDAVQALGLVAFRVATLGADSLAVSAHKVHGPRGAGALWIRHGARIAPLWEGGGQERGTRAGSENLPAIVGFARAAILATRARATGAGTRMATLRDQLEAHVLGTVPGAALTVSPTAAQRAPHISSLSFPGLPAEPLLHALGARGVTASAGSACASKVRGPSHVLKAMGVDDDTAVLRFSLSRGTTTAEIESAATAVAAAVAEIGETVKPGHWRGQSVPVVRDAKSG